MNILKNNNEIYKTTHKRWAEVYGNFNDYMYEHDELWNNFPEKFNLYFLKDETYAIRSLPGRSEPGFIDILVRPEEPFDIIEIDGVPAYQLAAA